MMRVTTLLAALLIAAAAQAEPLDVHSMREDIWKQLGGIKTPSDLDKAKALGRQLEAKRDAVMEGLRKHLESKGLKPPVWSGGLPSKGAGVHSLPGQICPLSPVWSLESAATPPIVSNP